MGEREVSCSHVVHEGQIFALESVGEKSVLHTRERVLGLHKPLSQGVVVELGERPLVENRLIPAIQDCVWDLAAQQASDRKSVV